MIPGAELTQAGFHHSTIAHLHTRQVASERAGVHVARSLPQQHLDQPEMGCRSQSIAPPRRSGLDVMIFRPDARRLCVVESPFPILMFIVSGVESVRAPRCAGAHAAHRPVDRVDPQPSPDARR
ncbi:unnamed protein product [Cutaneotrichosporon oleaginosum]